MIIEISGVRINYLFVNSKVNSKSKPVIIFLHEGLGSIGTWKDFPETLCKTLGLSGLVYDRQGYGGSDFWQESIPENFLGNEGTKVLPALIKKLGIDTHIVFGHSDGATIALFYASVRPEKLKGIVAEAPHVIIEGKTADGVAKLKQGANHALFGKLDRYQNGRGKKLFEYWTDYWLRPEFLNWNMIESLKKINIPILLIQGNKDAYGSFRQFDVIEQNVRSKDLVREELSCGHIPHFEAGEQVLRASAESIKRWLNN